MASVTIGSNSIISASNADAIVDLGSNSEVAFSLSKTLQYIYTSVKNTINELSLNRETNVNYDIFNLYAAGLTVYEFKNFLESRGYVVKYKQNDKITDVSNQSYTDDDDIKSNLYNSSSNTTGIKYVNIDWSSPASTSNYVITISV